MYIYTYMYILQNNRVCIYLVCIYRATVIQSLNNVNKKRTCKVYYNL